MGSCLSTESRSPVPGSPMSPSPGVRKRKNSNKKSSDYLIEEPLHKIPGRFFLNGSTEFASLFNQQGRKGTNQDAMIVWENFGSRTDTVFCGVFDGHGPYGHLVARRVRDSLPLKLNSYWKVNVNGEFVLREISTNATSSANCGNSSSMCVEGEVGASLEVEEVDRQPEILQTLKELFLKAFKLMDRELRIHANIDCFCSGTTAVTLIKQGNFMVIGNVGDSRAVLGTQDDDGDLIAVQLTVDLKPSLPVEAERIRKCRGRVFALHDEPEVARVWLPNNDSPGLAMARAFGDFCLKDFGLISVPDVSCRCISEKDQFVVLATDGIWDVLTNEEVVDIVASAPARSCAARALVETAVRAWRHKYPSSKIDDCAVVCLFLDSNDLSTASDIENKEKIASVDQADSNSQKDQSGPTTFVDFSRASQADITGGRKEPSKQEELGLESENGWYALEGVSRVNTLLNLPRFVPGREERAPGR